LDTGATKDYVSLEVASWLITNGVKSNNNELGHVKNIIEIG
jgi:hypothetical protein